MTHTTTGMNKPQINPESDCRKLIKILRLEAYIKTSAEKCAFNYAIQCSSLGMQTFPVVGSLHPKSKLHVYIPDMQTNDVWGHRLFIMSLTTIRHYNKIATKQLKE